MIQNCSKQQTTWRKDVSEVPAFSSGVWPWTQVCYYKILFQHLKVTPGLLHCSVTTSKQIPAFLWQGWKRWTSKCIVHSDFNAKLTAVPWELGLGFSLKHPCEHPAASHESRLILAHPFPGPGAPTAVFSHTEQDSTLSSAGHRSSKNRKMVQKLTALIWSDMKPCWPVPLCTAAAESTRLSLFSLSL